MNTYLYFSIWAIVVLVLGIQLLLLALKLGKTKKQVKELQKKNQELLSKVSYQSENHQTIDELRK